VVLNLLEQAPDKTKSTVLTLPFSTSTKDRTLPFKEEMEMAAVFTMAESDRKKGEGLILKKAAQELVFLSKLYYPLWLAPWNGQTLCFDGLGVSKQTEPYDVLPEIKAFIGDVKGSASTRQAYSAALQDHLHRFKSIKGVEEKVFPGLIASADFLQDFKHFLTEADETDQSKIEGEFLTPAVEETAISSALSELSELRTTLETDMQNIREAMRLLNGTTKQHVDTIRVETKKMQADLNQKIADAKAKAADDIRVIQEKYDARILKTSQRFDKQLEDLHHDRVKLEKDQQRAIEKIERCETEMEASRARKDSASQKRWKDEKETWKREASVVKKSIDAMDKQIEQTESQKKVEITNVRGEFNAESEEAMKPVRELEASKDSKTKLAQQEAKSLEDVTSNILGQLDVLSKKKRSSLEELNKIGMKDQRRKRVLAFVSFYMACFKDETGRRFMVYSPSIAGSMKTTTKLKGMLGMSKLGSLFQQRSRAVANVLNQVTTLAARDPVFEKDLYDLGVHANILKSAESRERIVKGIHDLQTENWTSVQESQNLTASLKT
jgi:hypothetical protein